MKVKFGIGAAVIVVALLALYVIKPIFFTEFLWNLFKFYFDDVSMCDTRNTLTKDYRKIDSSDTMYQIAFKHNYPAVQKIYLTPTTCFL